MSLWKADRIANERALTAHDVTRAHIAAPYVLAAWEARDARFWRRTLVALAIGAIVPLLAILVVDWSPFSVVLSVAFDVLLLWLCDALKPVLAYQRVLEEEAHQAEAADVLAVVEAIQRPRRSSSRRPLTAQQEARLARGESSLRRESLALRWIGAALIGGLVALSLVTIASLSPALLPWFVVATVMRLVATIATTLHAARDPGWRPELLPEASSSTLALCLVGFPVVLVAEVTGNWMASLDPAVLGTSLLGLYLIAATAVAHVGLRRVRDVATDLRAFLQRDRRELEQRVRNAND